MSTDPGGARTAPEPAGQADDPTAGGAAPAGTLATAAVPARVRRRATGRRRSWVVDGAQRTGRRLSAAAFDLEVRGREHVPATGPVLLASNHAGFLDGPLVFLLAPRPASVLTKSELFVGPLARALGWLGQIPVHRGTPDRRALRQALDVLEAGGALGVFPEGTRGTGRLEQVNDGLGWLALRSGAPVVPIAVLGSAEAMPRGARLPRWRAPVRVVFGAPVHVDVAGDPRARRTVRAAGEQLRLALLAHLESASSTEETAP